MKVPSHVVGLYHRTVRKYRKLYTRLQRQTDSTGYTYQILLHKLRKLRKKLEALHTQLKIAAGAGIIALALSASTAKAQTTTNNGPFVLQERHVNPLREPFKFDNATYPAVVDLDQDGDFDLVVGDQQYLYYGNYTDMGPLRYFVNTGTNSDPVFNEKKDAENPFSSLQINSYRRGPVFADIDDDGDMDLFLGLDYYPEAKIKYYRNDNGVFTEQTGAWDPATRNGNPFDGLSLNYTAKLAFADFDNDDDLDAIITSTFIDDATGSQSYVAFYKNDGNGTFTDATSELTFTPDPSSSAVNPALADVDKDGDIDIVLGGYYLGTGLHYYKQVAPGQFVRETLEYDPVLNTGNPFYHVSGPSTQPVFVDLDNDTDLDLLVGGANGDHWYPYPNTIIRYYENTGDAVYTGKEDLENPLGGVDVRREAAPVFVDLDDDGDLDVLIGNKYRDNYYYPYNSPVEYEFNDGKYHRVSYEDGEESPFSQVIVRGRIIPSMGDLDGDGDLDLISGDSYGGVHYFVNIDGIYTEVIDDSPFLNLDLAGRLNAQLKDIDGDGDLDLVVASDWDGWIRYFENVGTPQVPAFEELTGEQNPFNVVGAEDSFRGLFHLSDVDHDGDLDLIAVEYHEFKYQNYNHLSYYENTGTATDPFFERAENQPFIVPDQDPTITFGFGPKPYLADADQDGDLDLFIGVQRGFVVYVRNDNPSVVTSIPGGSLTFRVGVDEEIVVAPTLTLSDEDDDLIVQATVTITNFEEGDELHFVGADNISGIFDDDTGVLTLKGKATMQEYEAVLRTVVYHQHKEDLAAGRKSPRKSAIVSKTIAFRVYDTDFTDPLVVSRGLNILYNQAPTLENATRTTQVGQTVSVDLSQLMSDPDGNIDLTTLKVVQQPASGAIAQIDANGNLVINYQGLHFVGVDHLTIEVCDDMGECAQNIITIEVQGGGEVEIFNAIAPNGNGNNAYMRIFNLPAPNKVTIFTRWGDKVFAVDNYDDTVPGKRFEGNNDNGNALSSGTYFYRIEILNAPGYTGPKLLTGYITLKQ